MHLVIAEKAISATLIREFDVNKIPINFIYKALAGVETCFHKI